MNERRVPAQRPGRHGRGRGARNTPRTSQERATPPPGTGSRGGWMSDPRTWPGRMWRQVISQALFIVLMLSGLGLVAVSAKSLDQAIIWGILVTSVVVALWIGREMR